ncbi:MAG: cell division ATP-binding protein FtsE, partial [Gammaproteobacteria bacterium]
MIRINNVSKRYDNGFEALSDIDLHLPPGTLAFLTGHSGAGKTTLLRLLALMERPSRGQIVVNGLNLANVNRRSLPHYRRQVGIVFQDHRLLKDRSVFDNVALPLTIAGLPKQDISKRVRGALDKVGLLQREKAMPETLSAGEQQRVGIARAVVNRPKLLLADEPTGNLDPALSREVMGIFEWFQSAGTTLLIATHDLGLIRRMSHP